MDFISRVVGTVVVAGFAIYGFVTWLRKNDNTSQKGAA